MIKESFAYRLCILMLKYLKESRVYEHVCNLFYFSRYSALFEFVRKKPKEDYIQKSFFWRKLIDIYSKIVKSAHQVFISSKVLWSNSFLIYIIRQQKRILNPKPSLFSAFYILIFYTGVLVGKIVKGEFSVKSILIWTVLLVLNLVFIQDAKKRFSDNSIIVRFFKDIFA